MMNFEFNFSWIQWFQSRCDVDQTGWEHVCIGFHMNIQVMMSGCLVAKTDIPVDFNVRYGSRLSNYENVTLVDAIC